MTPSKFETCLVVEVSQLNRSVFINYSPISHHVVGLHLTGLINLHNALRNMLYNLEVQMSR